MQNLLFILAQPLQADSDGERTRLIKQNDHSTKRPRSLYNTLIY